MIEAHTILIRRFDKLLECVLHAEELLLGQITLEYAKLNTLTKILQNFVNTIGSSSLLVTWFRRCGYPFSDEAIRTSGWIEIGRF